jgi:hypothetical protein
MKRHSKKNDMADLLKSKNVLYVVLFFSVMNLFSYLMLKQLDAVVFFIIIGFLTTYFSKNMIIILLTSMISTFLLVQIKMLGNVQEGMDATETDSDTTKADATKADASKADATKAAVTKPDVTKAADAAPPDATAGGVDINSTLRAALTKPKEEKDKKKDDKTSTPTTTEKFSQQISPARYNAMDDDDVPRHKPKVDYAATLESAYDNLDKLLSSDAIKNMTEDTGRLAEKQKLLMGNIEKIAPIMEKAGNILQGFDMSAITKLMTNVGNSTALLKDNKPVMDVEGFTMPKKKY